MSAVGGQVVERAHRVQNGDPEQGGAQSEEASSAAAPLRPRGNPKAALHGPRSSAAVFTASAGFWAFMMFLLAALVLGLVFSSKENREVLPEVVRDTLDRTSKLGKGSAYHHDRDYDDHHHHQDHVEHGDHSHDRPASSDQSKDETPQSATESESNFQSQAGQDRWLVENVFTGKNEHRGKGFFIEVGARNGVQDSKTFHFEKSLGWRGILVEPSPKEHGDIANLRNNSVVINGAICESGKTATFVDLGSGRGRLLDSDKSRLDDQVEGMKGTDSAESIEVRCYTLRKLLKKFEVEAVDFMSVDTSGNELDALETFPFKKVPVRVISIEVPAGPKGEGAKARTVQFMESKGYKLLKEHDIGEDSVDLMFEPVVLYRRAFEKPRADWEEFDEEKEECKRKGTCL